jgi:hypothetical protein
MSLSYRWVRAASRLVVLVAALTVAGPAGAGKSDDDAAPERVEIQVTGITAFDSVFSKVGAIHATLDGAQGRIESARDKLAAVAGQPAGTPVANSMWELKQKAGGKLQVQVQNGKPVLSAAGTDFSSALSGVNSAIADVAKVPAELAKLPAQVQELIAACQALPAQLNPTLLQEAGMKVTDLPGVAKKLGANVKATTQTPGRITSLVKDAENLLTGVPQGLAATEPPPPPGEKAEKSSKDKDNGKEDEASAPPSALAAEVEAAWGLVQDAEVPAALARLDAAMAGLPKLKTPVPAADLQGLYQTRSFVLMVQGDMAGASAATTQALVADPEAEAIERLGPEYAKLHKTIAKSGLIRTISVTISGGEVWVSGVVASGKVKVGEGAHLVQVVSGGVASSSWRTLKDGDTLP